jgi:DNA polymerase I-like protein with 3'-5' exonuclease and polymerase domains
MQYSSSNLPRNTCLWKMVTETFRLSSSKVTYPRGTSYGTNLQNSKKNLTRIYIPDEGKILVNVDQSGAEALVVAYEADDGNFRRLFQNGIKSHVFVALHVFADVWQRMHPDAKVSELLAASPKGLREHPDFEKVEESIKASDNNPPSSRYYHIAKMACHALNYGMKPRTFQQNTLEKSEGEIVLTFQEATRIYDIYHDLFPEIKKWHARVIDELRKTRTLRNLFGFPRKFTHRWSDDLIRQSLAFTPQSTVGTITNLVYVQMQQHIEDAGLDWDMLNNKHDSVLVQCPIDDSVKVKEKVQEYMNIDLISTTGEAFQMQSGAERGFNWYPAGENNPRGMEGF